MAQRRGGPNSQPSPGQADPGAQGGQRQPDSAPAPNKNTFNDPNHDPSPLTLMGALGLSPDALRDPSSVSKLAQFNHASAKGSVLNDTLAVAEARAAARLDSGLSPSGRITSRGDFYLHVPGAEQLFTRANEAVTNPKSPALSKAEELFVDSMGWRALAGKQDLEDFIPVDGDPEARKTEQAKRRSETVQNTEDFYESSAGYHVAQQEAIALKRTYLEGKRDQSGISKDLKNHYEELITDLDEYEQVHAGPQPASVNIEASQDYIKWINSHKGRDFEVNPLTDDEGLKTFRLQNAVKAQARQDQLYVAFDKDIKKIMRDQLNAKENDAAVHALEHHVKDLEAKLATRYMSRERGGGQAYRSEYDKAVQDLLLLKARIEGRKNYTQGKIVNENIGFQNDLMLNEADRAKKTADASQESKARRILNLITHRTAEGQRKKGMKFWPEKVVAHVGKIGIVGALALGFTPASPIVAAAAIGTLVGTQAYAWANARSGRMRFHQKAGGLVEANAVGNAIDRVTAAGGTRRQRISAAQAEAGRAANEYATNERKKSQKRKVGAAVVGGLLPFSPWFLALSAPIYRWRVVKHYPPKPGSKKKKKGGHGHH